jgi:hypothetical protein
MDDTAKFRGLTFQQGLQIIESAWRESDRAMLDQCSRLEAELRQARAKEKGNAQTLLSGSYIIEYQLKQTALAIQTLREAFVLAMYHFWERALIDWMGNKNASYGDKYEWLAKHGLPLAKDCLEDLRELCRLLKHEKGDNILKRRPDYFATGTPVADDLHMTTAHMGEFLAGLRDSGYPWPNTYFDAKDSGA